MNILNSRQLRERDLNKKVDDFSKLKRKSCL